MYAMQRSGEPILDSTEWYNHVQGEVVCVALSLDGQQIDYS